MEFGIRLKNERESKGISQGDFAKMLGVSRSSVGNYETSRNMPTVEILYKMSDILECSTDYLLCKSNIRNPECIKIDFGSDEYSCITDEQKKQIEDFVKFVLKDNKKEKNSLSK